MSGRAGWGPSPFRYPSAPRIPHSSQNSPQLLCNHVSPQRGGSRLPESGALTAADPVPVRAIRYHPPPPPPPPDTPHNTPASLGPFLKGTEQRKSHRQIYYSNPGRLPLARRSPGPPVPGAATGMHSTFSSQADGLGVGCDCVRVNTIKHFKGSSQPSCGVKGAALYKEPSQEPRQPALRTEL